MWTHGLTMQDVGAMSAEAAAVVMSCPFYQQHQQRLQVGGWVGGPTSRQPHGPPLDLEDHVFVHHT